jgi:D-glycero-alpha-D-manno-heptose 1-phosphate guanylyltransferase
VRLANGGVYLVNPCALSAILNLFKGKVSLEDDIFPVSIALEQRLFGKEFQNTFIDIGVPEDYKRASNLFTL